MRLFLTLALLASFEAGSAQVYFNTQIDWEQNFEFFDGVAVMPDGTLFLVGGEGNFSPFYQATFLVQINDEGQLLWAKSFLPKENASGNTSSLVSVLGGVVILGNYFIPVANSYNLQIFFTKLNGTTGDTLWVKEYGQLNVADNGLRIISTADRGFAISGWAFLDNNTQHSRLLLLKTDSLGNQTFRKEYTTDGSKDHFAYSLTQTPDGGYLLFGFSSYEGPYLGGVGTANKIDMILLKTDAQGNQQWVKVYPPWEWKQILFYGLDLQPLSNGDFLMTGLKSYALFQPGNTYTGKYFFGRINSLGEFVDSVTFPQSYYFFKINRLKPTFDGNFWAIGAERDSQNLGQTGLIMKITPNLEIFWKREYRVSPPESMLHEIFYEGVEMPDHGFVLCGGAFGSLDDSTNANGWVIRVDSFGCLEPGCQLNSAVEDPPIPEQDIGLSLSPNPTSGQSRLTLTREGAVLLGVRVLDVQGRVVSDVQFLRGAG
ncbi:MAG: hypothetical protein Q7T20_07655, partial [Saprospiraceae bacterium]|nr:hypothetical protein [Saprospiraceae bacterium]